MEIIIFDYLGIHSGMHYYLDSFREELLKIEGAQVSVKSNFAEHEAPFFLFQYRGGRLLKACCALRNIIRFRRFVRSHPHACCIFLSYGHILDTFFLKGGFDNVVVDVHEAIEQRSDSSKFLFRRFSRLYSRNVKNVIYHSDRTKEFLDAFGYAGGRFFVPHFRYLFEKKCDESLVGEDLKTVFDHGRTNVLFFGNLNYDKGADIMVSAVNSLPEDERKRLNVVMAGKNVDGSCFSVKNCRPELMHIVPRHISDDELVYIYENADYVSLPYRKTSQSGILEMAVYFKRPVIVSDIPYFRDMLKRFPSFGLLAGNGPQAFAAALMTLPKDTSSFFDESDYYEYEHRSQMDAFLKEFSSLFNGRG